MSRTTLVFIVVLIGISTALMACAGMDFGDLVQVETPVEIQRDKGYPKRMSLNQSKELFTADHEDFVRNFNTWRGSIESGDQLVGMLNQMSLQGLNELGPQVAGVPVLGPAFPFITGLAGFALQRVRTESEKRKSYNKGLQVGAETARGNGTNTQG